MLRDPRQALLLGLALAMIVGGAPRQVGAIGSGSLVRLTLLSLPGGAAQPSAGAKVLAGLVGRRTHIKVARNPKQTQPTGRDLLKHPLLWTTASGALPRLDAQAVARLRRHLTRGGTWVLDGPPKGAKQVAFRQSVARVVRRIFPRAKAKALAGTHTLFKSFYLLRPATFKLAGLPILGLHRDGRSPIVVVHGLLAALQGQQVGARRERLIRLGINLVMYALCVDYKSDQVHAPAIMKRRRWKAR